MTRTLIVGTRKGVFLLGRHRKEWRIERAACEQPVEALLGVEAAHLYRVVERLACAGERGRGGRTGDRHDLEVELWRGAAIERELELAKALACCQRGEIEKAEVDRLFQLVGGVTGEQDARDVRLNQPQLGSRVCAGQGLAQAVDERRVRVLRHCVAPCSGPDAVLAHRLPSLRARRRVPLRRRRALHRLRRRARCREREHRR